MGFNHFSNLRAMYHINILTSSSLVKSHQISMPKSEIDEYSMTFFDNFFDFCLASGTLSTGLFVIEVNESNQPLVDELVKRMVKDDFGFRLILIINGRPLNKIVSYFKAGVMGIISRDTLLDELILSIQTVLDGRRYLDISTLLALLRMKPYRYLSYSSDRLGWEVEGGRLSQERDLHSQVSR